MKSVLHIQRLDELAATVSLPQLLDSYLLHLRTVIAATATNLPPLAPPAAVVAGHALSAVVCACGLGERVASGRWEMVHEALAHGATIAQVCAASGLEPDEIRVGLSSWADAQHSMGCWQLDATEYVLTGVASAVEAPTLGPSRASCRER